MTITSARRIIRTAPLDSPEWRAARDRVRAHSREYGNPLAGPAGHFSAADPHPIDDGGFYRKG